MFLENVTYESLHLKVFNQDPNSSSPPFIHETKIRGLCIQVIKLLTVHVSHMLMLVLVCVCVCVCVCVYVCVCVCVCVCIPPFSFR